MPTKKNILSIKKEPKKPQNYYFSTIFKETPL